MTRIGIVGTFDVMNFGDLLFPLLAEHELRERLGDATVTAYSHRELAPPAWPYPVRPLERLPHELDTLDLLLVGGGVGIAPLPYLAEELKSPLFATPFTAGLIAASIVAVLAIVGGAIAGLVSWIGALVNTAALEDKAWFILLLVLGLLSFGFIAMIAYVIGGPDSTRPQLQRAAQRGNLAAGA